MEKRCTYNQYYSDSCFSPFVTVQTSWFDVPYAGTTSLPVPETPNAKVWPLAFFKRIGPNQFVNLCGELADTTIANPYRCLDLATEFKYLSNVQCNLTEKQIRIARFWDVPYQATTLVDIARQLIINYELTLVPSLRILYLLSAALNDSTIINFEQKYYWKIIRPSQYNQCFKTVICTPSFPSYPAAHSTAGGCFAELMSYFFPCERQQLFAIAQQSSLSRIYAGVHYPLDASQGFLLGVNIAKSIISYLQTQESIQGVPIIVRPSSCKNMNIMPDMSGPLTNYGNTNCDYLLLHT